MDAEKNFESFKKELKKLLTKKGFEKTKRWIRRRETEVEVDIPLPDNRSIWEFFSLSSPELAARRVAKLVKEILKSYKQSLYKRGLK